MWSWMVVLKAAANEENGYSRRDANSDDLASNHMIGRDLTPDHNSLREFSLDKLY